MNYHEATGSTIDEAFTKYHEENPEVFEMFKKYLREIVQNKRARGIKSKDIKTSSKMILNRIRWEVSNVGIVTNNSENKAEERVFDSFKINDAFTSRYARLFCDQNPEWSHLFNLRELRTGERLGGWTP